MLTISLEMCCRARVRRHVGPGPRVFRPARTRSRRWTGV
ncbi:hypothetical protein ATKI12_0969 [Kitasatospora sp. Ki12]